MIRFTTSKRNQKRLFFFFLHMRLWPRGGRDLFPFFASGFKPHLSMSVTLAVPYMLTGLAGCSVSPMISCGARKLTRTTRVTKKKKKEKRLIIIIIIITFNIFFPCFKWWYHVYVLIKLHLDWNNIKYKMLFCTFFQWFWYFHTKII